MPDTSKDPKTYALIGAAMEVHRQLGCGFLEPIYQEAFDIELRLRNIPFLREEPIAVYYKGNLLQSTYKPDFICYGEIIVELKALTKLSGSEESQLLNYLKATNFPVGILLNFGKPSLEFERFIRNPRWRPPIDPQST
ncbi:MAG: GxxExxY protein [Planctomycetes bacterium]|nr:GxxExxY protein [Planctomycetota bacterium]